jgi:Family of unknown function (DUF6402)
MSGIFNDFLLKRLRDTSTPIELSRAAPVAACFKNLNLIDIPRVMREKKLTIGAAIMEHWFLGKAFVMPAAWKAAPPKGIDPRTIKPDHIDETIITMKWVLEFARALSTYNELRSAVLGNLGAESQEASKRELFNCLKSDGKFTKKVEIFGFGSGKNLHKTAHVNTRIVSSNMWAKLSDPLDDMYCALGVFGIHVAAYGSVTPLDPKANDGTHQVKIVKLGFYIKDTYDFAEDQPLGLWSEDGAYKMPASGRFLVENKSFRDWRARFNQGGDFMIFSDVRWEAIPSPLIWNYTVS